MFNTRAATRGNKGVDYTKIREDLKTVNPAIAATLRNATPKNGVTPEKDEGGGKTTVNPYKLERLSNIISNNINAATDLRSITPYIDKANQIWNTVIFYPNGKQDKLLSYDTQNTKYKNAALHTGLVAIWDNYFTNDYKIEPELPEMLSDIMWNTGSYALFNLSRPGLDYLINGSALDPTKRTGNEAYERAKAELEREFVTVDGVKRMVNKGRFVRDPNSPTGPGAVSGMEAILGNRPEYNGHEFRLFSREEDPDNVMNITLTDNPAILYLQKFKERARQHDIASVMGAESFDNVIMTAMASQKKKQKAADGPDATTQNLTEEQLNALNMEVYKSRDIRQQSLQFVKAIDELSVAPYGRGLSWHIPSEAIFPIHHNGSNGKLDDYIILLDDEGNFLKNTDDPEFYQSLKKNKESIVNKNKTGSENSLISSLKMVQSGAPCDFDMSEFADLSSKNLVRKFLSSVFSGKGDSISITLDEAVNKIFLSRIWRKQGVRCLYVPGEAVSYGAFRYNRLGVGQSLTQTAKTHIARLAAYDVADALANLEAAQPHTEMTINIEKEDSDPEQSIATARATFFDTNPKLHSILASAQLSVPQVVDALRESSLSVKVNAGDNVHLPTPDISTMGKPKDNFHPVDPDSRNAVLNSISNYFNLPRAWLDVSDDQNNFKIEAITEYDMVYNQGVSYQEMFCNFLTDFQRKHTRVNGPLMQELVTYILENKNNWTPDSKEKLEGTDEEKVKLILADFFQAIYCYLPAPTSTETTNKLKESLDAVDQLVTAWEEMSGNNVVMAAIIKALGIESEDFSADEIKAMVKSLLKSEAFKRFNLPMPFDDIVNDGKGGGMASLVESILHQRNNTADFVAKLILGVVDSNNKIVKSHKAKLDKKLAPPEPEVPEGGIPGEEGTAGGLDDGTGTTDGLDADAPEVPDESTEDDASTTDDAVPPDDGAPTPDEDTPAPDEEENKDDDNTPPDDNKPGGAKFNPF